MGTALLNAQVICSLTSCLHTCINHSALAHMLSIELQYVSIHLLAIFKALCQQLAMFMLKQLILFQISSKVLISLTCSTPPTEKIDTNLSKQAYQSSRQQGP